MDGMVQTLSGEYSREWERLTSSQVMNGTRLKICTSKSLRSYAMNGGRFNGEVFDNDASCGLVRVGLGDCLVFICTLNRFGGFLHGEHNAQE